MFKNAITKTPGPTYSSGLTTSNLGIPDLNLALHQHHNYCNTLEECGLRVTVLEPENEFPDSTFVEDTAILVKDCAILTHPGALSRVGEVDRIKPVLKRFFDHFEGIFAPGTLDGGDICEAGNHFFIGISERTNEIGARQLSSILTRLGFTTDFIDIRKMPEILHLKSGIAYLDPKHLVVIDPLYEHPAFKTYQKIKVHPDENYAANSILINNHVLIPTGFPRLAETIKLLGYSLKYLDMSEFQKMDGGLSCLSLRF